MCVNAVPLHFSALSHHPSHESFLFTYKQMDMNYICVQFMNTLIFIAQQTMYPSDYVKEKNAYKSNRNV